MTNTVYTFHRAADHAILATAEPGTLQAVAATIGQSLSRSMEDGPARRVYIHNGRGVVGAGLCRSGLWHDVLRDDYQQFAPQARALRVAAGLHNDPEA